MLERSKVELAWPRCVHPHRRCPRPRVHFSSRPCSLFLSFFLSPRPVGPRSPKRVPPWPPSCSYFFFSAAVSDTLVRLLTFHSPLILPFPPPLFFSSLSFFFSLPPLPFYPFRSPRALQVSAAPTMEEEEKAGRGEEDRRKGVGEIDTGKHWWDGGREGGWKKGEIEAENRTLPTKGPNNES